MLSGPRVKWAKRFGFKGIKWAEKIDFLPNNSLNQISNVIALHFLPHSIITKLSLNQSVIGDYTYSVYYVYAVLKRIVS